ncbi:hypothetical protein [Planococcus salinus]|uniref:Uncharacterized protein n=1 Tax=Planococcus salinus TaxID=1848460 RepID=A0A3M8P7G4_9BACL|nr:hypothetical protein [Planococcus salinus]RNF39371.1 hypothetical protein EEX84_09810 [Planococcus salinus]
MKRKKILLWIVAIVAVIVSGLTVLGMVFSTSEEEKLTGMSGFFDISAQGTIAYVSYTEGKPEIQLVHPGQSVQSKAVELENDQVILDPTFSTDGSSLAYISTNKNPEEELKSTVHQLNLQTKEDQELFSAGSAITEIEFSPTDGSLFYLNAAVFTNYSPITGKRPHDFDIHEYNFEQNEHMQHTDLKKYSMDSLTIGEDGEVVYVQMPDDAAVETAEDSFEVVQRIFEIPLEDPESLRPIIIEPEREMGVFDFAIVPGGDEIIYQAVSNADEGGTFQYELYKYDRETQEDQQLTDLQEYADRPVIHPETGEVYFIVDMNFAGRATDYHLYKMNMEGSEVEEVSLPERGSSQ